MELVKAYKGIKSTYIVLDHYSNIELKYVTGFCNFSITFVLNYKILLRIFVSFLRSLRFFNFINDFFATYIYLLYIFFFNQQ